MKKVLLVQSYLGDHAFPAFPIGLSYLGAWLPEDRFEVRGLDLNRQDNPYETLRATLADFRPDAVGVSLRNIDSQCRWDIRYFYKEFQSGIRIIREAAPDTPIIVGGAGFSMFARTIMERNPELNLGIYLEGEKTFLELLENLDDPSGVAGAFHRDQADPSQVVFTGPRPGMDLAEQKMPRWDLFDLSRYPADRHLPVGVETKRGCHLNCAYCNYPFLSGRKVRLRKPEHVVDEIQELTQKRGVEGIIFTDSVFNVPVDHATAICEEMVARSMKIRWAAYLDIRFASRDFLLLAKKTGCTDFIFSPDGASEGGLKGLRKGITWKDIAATVKLFREDPEFQGLHCSFGFFVNPPGENFFGLLKTLWIYLWFKLILRGRGGSGLAFIRIEPDTEIYEIALREGVLSPDTDLLPDDVADLDGLFYSRPGLRWADKPVMLFLRSMNLLKRTVKKALGR